MKKVVIISGNGGSGKDTVCKIACLISDVEVNNFTSIGVVRKAAEILGWDGNKNSRDRKFLSDLKRLSTEYNDQPLHYLKFCMEKAEESTVNFLHIREPEEIERAVNLLSDQHKVYTLLVKRDTEVHGNYSDDNVEQYKYDYVINNNADVMSLRMKVEKFLSSIGVGIDESGHFEACNTGSRE